jgi:hypothetical protein
MVRQVQVRSSEGLVVALGGWFGVGAGLLLCWLWLGAGSLLEVS